MLSSNTYILQCGILQIVWSFFFHCHNSANCFSTMGRWHNWVYAYPLFTTTNNDFRDPSFVQFSFYKQLTKNDSILNKGPPFKCFDGFFTNGPQPYVNSFVIIFKTIKRSQNIHFDGDLVKRKYWFDCRYSTMRAMDFKFSEKRRSIYHN